MFKIVFVNHKGGVGKTTSAINTSHFLAIRGFRVLAVDMDPQANLTMGFGFSPVDAVGSFMSGETSINDSLLHYSPYISVMPSSDSLERKIKDIEKKSLRPYEIMKHKINQVSGYDFVITDTQPNAVSTLSLNAMVMSDYIIIPTEASEWSVAGIRNIYNCVNEIRSQLLNPDIVILGLLITFYEKNNTCQKYRNTLMDAFTENEIFRTYIRKNVALASAAGKHSPISDKYASGYVDYSDFADEVIGRLPAVAPRTVCF